MEIKNTHTHTVTLSEGRCGFRYTSRMLRDNKSGRRRPSSYCASFQHLAGVPFSVFSRKGHLREPSVRVRRKKVEMEGRKRGRGSE